MRGPRLRFERLLLLPMLQRFSLLLIRHSLLSQVRTFLLLSLQRMMIRRGDISVKYSSRLRSLELLVDLSLLYFLGV
ncbi:hypothetical protein QJS10_CPA01g02031 [Acorus calamus]|uniref:Uncharacterized protein n=1 Tax=Acorus calamus TaxID=4465 RepID=A0AAV9FKX9_ACOCL|nr:hypothetical protein QJS10_CPA01g02031 [Acorus calamus]